VTEENIGQRFDRLPSTAAEQTVPGRPTREEVLTWWNDRFDVPSEVFDNYTFWEKGSGKLWAFAGNVPSPAEIEALGITFLRVRQEHWKPTTDAVQRFGNHATQNVISLDDAQARAFVAGDDQELPWEGDWGYLIVTHDIAGESEPLGVGLYLYGELRSQIPKGRRREID
jgi:NOL1/NOP2/fmu family ribosome biogenesis protein